MGQRPPTHLLSVALGGALTATLLGGCSTGVPDLTTPASAAELLGRPAAPPIAEALEQAQAYGPATDLDEADYLCAAEAMVEDARLSDETLRALASMDPDYARSVADLDPDEAAALTEALDGCIGAN